MKKKNPIYEAGLPSLLSEERQEGWHMFNGGGNKYKEGLQKGNPAAAKSKREKSKEYQMLWRKFAIETYIANPLWNLDKIAEHILEISLNCGHRMANGKPYSASYIKSKIYGIEKEAIQTLKK